MPTAAKLVAALAFAALGWLACVVLDDVMPETTVRGRMLPVAVVCGLIAGWTISGAAKRASMMEAAATGMRTSSTATLMALVVLAVGAMLRDSLRGFYRKPMDAVLDVFDRFVDYGSLLMSIPVLGVVFLGGMMGGMLTEAVGRRWR